MIRSTCGAAEGGARVGGWEMRRGVGVAGVAIAAGRAHREFHMCIGALHAVEDASTFARS